MPIWTARGDQLNLVRWTPPPPPHRRKEEEEESMLLSNKDYQFALDRMSCIHNHCRSTGTSQTFLSCHMSSPEIKFKDKRVGTERLARIRWSFRAVAKNIYQSESGVDHCCCFRIRISIYCRYPVLRIRIRVFLGLQDPDPLIRGMDPEPDPALVPDPDPSIIMQK
jgi:hypothetical protein